MWDLNSLTRDQTHRKLEVEPIGTPALESEVLTTGPPGKSHYLSFRLGQFPQGTLCSPAPIWLECFEARSAAIILSYLTI